MVTHLSTNPVQRWVTLLMLTQSHDLCRKMEVSRLPLDPCYQWKIAQLLLQFYSCDSVRSYPGHFQIRNPSVIIRRMSGITDENGERRRFRRFIEKRRNGRGNKRRDRNDSRWVSDRAVQFTILVCFVDVCLRCFDAVGWAAGRASGLYKSEWWGTGMVICLERGANDFHVIQLMPLPPHLLLQ